MGTIVDEIMTMLSSGNHIPAISSSVGGDQTAVTSALGMAMPLLLGAMANHAATPAGNQMLTKTLAQAGTSNPLDNMSGLLSNPAAAGGSGMVDALLGSQAGTIQNSIAQKTGLPPAAVSQVMAIAAPIIIGHLGTKVSGQGDLQGLLASHSKAALDASPDASALAEQLPAARQSGVSGMLKKFLGQ